MTKIVQVQGTGVIVSDTVEANGLSPFMRTVVQATTAVAALALLGGAPAFVATPANLVWAGPASGADAAPGMRALVVADIPNLSTSILTSGTLAVTRGGTGLATAALGDLHYGSGANTLAILSGNVLSVKRFLTQTGTGLGSSAAPAWGQVVATDLPATLNSTSFPSIFVDAASGTERQLGFKSSGSVRWLVMAGNATESGLDAGSGFLVRAYKDDGATIIDTPIAITRAAGGAITFARPLSLFDGGAVTLGIAAGTQWGTAANQKQGWFGATPIIQPIGTTDLRTALINLGLYAGGGASPLNLNGGAFTAQSVTVSGLTPGGVATIGASGILAYSAGLLYSSNLLTVGDGTASSMRMDGGTGTSRLISWRTAGSTRWTLGANGTAEGGSDAGSDFVINALTDAGAGIDNPFKIIRAAGGAIVTTRPLQPGSGSTGAPSYAFSTDTTTGFYRVGSGSVGLVASGTDRYRFGSTGQVTVSRNVAIGSLNSSVAAATDGFAFHGSDAADLTASLTSYTNDVALIVRVLGGTGATPAATPSGQKFTIGFRGYGNAIGGVNRAQIAMSATELWSATATGTQVTVSVSKDTTTTTATALTIAYGSTESNPTAVFAGKVTVGSLLVGANQVVGARKTGWAAWTGTATRTTFDTATATLVNVAQALKALIDDLHGTAGHGLIGT